MADNNKKEVEESARSARRLYWEKSWDDDEFSPIWRGRGIATQVVDSLESGWFPSTGSVLDIGCGEGVIAQWFAKLGYQSVGIDISQSVIDKARSEHAEESTKDLLEFHAVDITESSPPDKQYNILIDRGCLHSIPPVLIKNYVKNISAVSAKGARLLLFVRAFRDGASFNNEMEAKKHVQVTQKVFAGQFQLKRYAATNIGSSTDKSKEKQLPGMIFYLEKL
ncbi:MAG: hypothetical protein COB22_08110 [Cycloclasticus sp.]|nr:MAG: hypothetical protein COB22_08110 [Cycloclasticus sp.]